MSEPVDVLNDIGIDDIINHLWCRISADEGPADFRQRLLLYATTDEAKALRDAPPPTLDELSQVFPGTEDQVKVSEE